MKAVTEVPTKYSKWCIFNDKTHETLYASTDKSMATALVVGQAFVSKIHTVFRSDARVTLYTCVSRKVGDAVAYCYGIVHYDGHTCGKMIDAKTHKHYLADIINGQRINKSWSVYDTIF